MQTITTVGLDIAKSVFQVHGVDADGNVAVRREAIEPSSTANEGATKAQLISERQGSLGRSLCSCS